MLPCQFGNGTNKLVATAPKQKDDWLHLVLIGPQEHPLCWWPQPIPDPPRWIQNTLTTNPREAQRPLSVTDYQQCLPDSRQQAPLTQVYQKQQDDMRFWLRDIPDRELCGSINGPAGSKWWGWYTSWQPKTTTATSLTIPTPSVWFCRLHLLKTQMIGRRASQRS